MTIDLELDVRLLVFSYILKYLFLELKIYNINNELWYNYVAKFLKKYIYNNL